MFVITIFWSVAYTFTFASMNYGLEGDLGWYIVLYMFGGFIRRYVNTNKCNAGKHILAACFWYFVIILSNVLLIFLGGHLGIEKFSMYNMHFGMLRSLFVLLTAVELIIAFSKMKIKNNTIINVVAGATLGVYLIHDNPVFRPYLWQTVLKNPEVYHSNGLIIHAVISIIAVFVVCTIVDLIRQATVEKVFLKLLDKYLDAARNKIIKIFDRVLVYTETVLKWYYR